MVASLTQYAQGLTEQHAIQVRFVAQGFEGGPRLPPDIETAIYRIVQESCINALRHAHASAISIVLQRQPGRTMAIVEDNGTGFDVEVALSRGRLGLVGMRERVEMVGGTLTIESRVGAGTTVYVAIPLSDSG